ncbi:MAG: sortase [Anaerolineae bacterium]|nr:sortase [Anaerolineae bacterium]
MFRRFIKQTLSSRLLSIPLFIVICLLVAGNVSAASVYKAVLIKDIYADSGSSSISGLINVNNTLYFSSTSSSANRELWKSDGTQDGTQKYYDFYQEKLKNYIPFFSFKAGNDLFFLSWDSSNSFVSLWKSDGSSSGTAIVSDFSSDIYNSPVNANVGADGTIYICGFYNRPQGTSVWKSDGTPSGTSRVFKNSSSVNEEYTCNILPVGDTLFLTMNDSSHGPELWTTDGTEDGTTLLKDIHPGTAGSKIKFLSDNGDVLYFSADDGTHGVELWQSDGTADGTLLIKDINPGGGSSNPANVLYQSGLLYFAADDGTHGSELWKSNGSEAGTSLVKDIFPGSGSSDVGKLTDLNGSILFRADDGRHTTDDPDNIHGWELWKTDGTQSGTVMVKDTNPDDEFGAPLFDFTVFDGQLFFSSFGTGSNTNNGIWRSDGTAAGTMQVKAFCPNTMTQCLSSLTPMNGKLYFYTFNGSENALWSISEGEAPVFAPAGGGSLVDNSVITDGITQFTVAFDMDVKHDGSAGAANNPVNYLLFEQGPNRSFDTQTCAAGIAGDDVNIAINSASYNPNNFVATLQVNNGVVLPDGSYRLLICGTTSIEDLDGNKLNGGVSDAQISFTVTGVSSAVSLPSTGFAPGKLSPLAHQPDAKAYDSSSLGIEIPALGVKSEILGIPQADGSWDVTWLGERIGYLEGLAFPTTPGNSVLTGHVWNADNSPGIFNQLKTLKYGDKIKISAWGQVYTYEVRENAKIKADDLKSAFAHQNLSWITLLTCEDYREKTNLYETRRAVRAVLVDVKALQ